MAEQLIPSRRSFDGADIIFTLNAEAQKRAAAGESVINATVGALLDDSGRLVVLDSVMALFHELTAAEVAPYAPITGDPAYLKALVARHWPELDFNGVGCATPGGTGALAFSIRNLLEPGMQLLTAAPYWTPYATLAMENGVGLRTVPYPAIGAPLDLPTWRGTLEAILQKQGRALLWLNDPCHNPTGRSLSREDRGALLKMLGEAAAEGPVTLLLDFAYLDYTKEPEAVAEALADYRVFAEAQAKTGGVLLAASMSLSKAFTLYGARAGALVFPWNQDKALQAALAISCRGTFSNCAKAPMSLLLRMEKDTARKAQLKEEQGRWSLLLEQRAEALDKSLRAEGLEGAPWQGGFFITLDVAEPFAVCERLKGHGVFVVPMAEGLRVGICGMKAADAPRLAAALKKSV